MLDTWIEMGGREDTGRRFIRDITGASVPARGATRTQRTQRRAGAASNRGKAKRQPKRAPRTGARRTPVKS